MWTVNSSWSIIVYMFSIFISSGMDEYLIPYHPQFVMLVTITGSNMCLILEVIPFPTLQGE